MLTGVLVDVSGSMKTSLQLNINPTDQQTTRAESIFGTIINIAKREVNYHENQEIFTLAFGLPDVNTCDLLSLLEYVKTLDESTDVDGHESLIQLLADNGAPRAGEYVRQHLTKKEALLLYNFFSEDVSELKKLVEQLPSLCKEEPHPIDAGLQARSKAESWANSVIRAPSLSQAKSVPQWMLQSGGTWVFKKVVGLGAGARAALIAGLEAGQEAAVQRVLKAKDIGANFGVCENSNETERQATREQADRAMKSAKEVIRKRTLPRLREMSRPICKSLESTINLLQEVAGTSPSSNSSPTQTSMSAAELSFLVDSIEPYIYGNTPMCGALRSALDMFHASTHSRKVLFLLSDGEATDGDPVQFAEQFRQNHVLIFVCLLTSDNISDPRRLYYDPDSKWSKAHRAMFELSSTVENCHSAMSILLEQGWELPEAGHSRLFIQANHPDVIKEFSNLLIYISEHNDVLLSMVGRVSLDMYINASNSTFEPRLQIGGTCYAHAVATVFHLAMRRIEGREGGVPDFADICQKLIDEYGKDGAVTETVLKIWAPKYRLHYKEVDERGARQAINRRRPVVATFHLNGYEWGAFSSFYKTSPKGVLESESMKKTDVERKPGGHAVVLMKCDPTSLTFINSWGAKFADNGFFRVRNQATLKLQFYDVYWDENELTASETQAFQRKSIEKGQDLIKKLPPGIQNLLYECPHCHESNAVHTFILHFLDAECPTCHKNFKPTTMGLNVTAYTR